ncbi:MAG TPA: right-handed parallel beta-helix repeat-containing protein [bacterium]
MVKSKLLRGSLLSLLIIAGLIGCSKPDSNPVTPPPEFRDGIPLDVNATYIARADRPYIVSENWVIPEGRTVEIQAGTEIMFDSLWWVDVAGKITAVGTASQPIIFTSARTSPAMGQWRGFKLHNPTDPSRFEHCVFSWGAFYDTDTTNVEAQTYRGMLAINNSSPVIERCVVVANQNNAVYMTGAGSAPRIRYNVLTFNDASAVRADTSVQLPEGVGETGRPDVSYNCVGGNHAISFLMGYDSSRYGVKFQTNQNLDSCDRFFNIDLDPKLTYMGDTGTEADPPRTWLRDGSDLALQSCSPAIDAGPAGEDLDQVDNTRADMGTLPYVQSGGELRGVVSGTLNAGITYRMSCNVRINPGTILTIPAGTHIETTGLYTIEVHGKLIVDGNSTSRARISVGATGGDLWGGIRFFNTDSLFTPSTVRGLDMVDYKVVDVYKPGVVFENCLFDHGFDYGMQIATQTPDFTDTVRVADCTFNACGLYGIKADSSATTIRNTVIRASRGRGIWLRNAGTAAEITNCIVHSNVTVGLALEAFSSPVLTNNVFAHNGYHGMDMTNNCDPHLRNTIVYHNDRYGLYVVESSTPVLDYNDVFGHVYISGQNSTDWNYMPADRIAHLTDLNADPQFAGETDFHLSASSPCRNAGMNPDGSPTDMGAFGGPNGGSVGAGAIRQSSGGLASK